MTTIALLHFVLPGIAGALLFFALLCKPESMLRGMGTGAAVGMMIMSFQYTTSWTCCMSIVCAICGFVGASILYDECSETLKRGEGNRQ